MLQSRGFRVEMHDLLGSGGGVKRRRLQEATFGEPVAQGKAYDVGTTWTGVSRLILHIRVNRVEKITLHASSDLFAVAHGSAPPIFFAGVY